MNALQMSHEYHSILNYSQIIQLPVKKTIDKTKIGKTKIGKTKIGKSKCGKKSIKLDFILNLAEKCIGSIIVDLDEFISFIHIHDN